MATQAHTQGALTEVERPWATSADEVLTELGVTRAGLTGQDARRLLAEVGPNRLAPPERKSLWRRILGHFDDVLIYILLVSAALKAILGDWVDFTVILAVAVINAGIGLIQEGRAERALDAIKDMLSVRAQARRDGSWADIDADDLVPGDVVRVRSGDRVPADVRLLDAVNLRVEESALTGESVPATKRVDAVAPEVGVGDRTSMLFSGTIVAAGTGTGVVVATGDRTEIGRIQQMIADVGELQTPLSRTLDQFGKWLAVLIIIMALVMTVIGRVLHQMPVDELLSAAIGFAVAAVPEGLPALVTITLALGVQQMARRRAITRQLPAVETLGSVTTICSDKTGTLTRNEMTARTVRTRSAELTVSGLGYAPEGEVSDSGEVVTVADRPDLALLATVMMLCNDAQIVRAGDAWRLVGEPTEGALRVLGLKAGLDPAGWRRVAAVPFESESKYMATLNDAPDGSRHVLVKGAPDRVLDRCVAQTGADGRAEPLDRAFWEAQIDEIGGRGLRVLAAAHAPASPDATTLDPSDVDTGLELVGLVGIVDPPRPEAIEAIAECRSAGVRVKMITGDHAGTALAIGREMGIVEGDGIHVLTGPELEAMTTEELRAVAQEVDVYARTSPEHKIRIVSALQSHGEVVAMTGDGVNDAPALTQADVGVAMGIKGTEATKEAADVVLADDNFASIEAAVEMGRTIYDNLRKAIVFILPTNGAQGLVILAAVVLGLTLPLTPVQVLWVNTITAVTLALALAFEPSESDIMRRPPRAPGGSILPRSGLVRIVYVSLLIGGATIAVFLLGENAGQGLAESRTVAVNTLVVGQIFYLFASRFSRTTSLRRELFTTNPVSWLCVGVMLGLQLLFVYTPAMHTAFGSTSVGLDGWLIPLAVGVAVLAVVEVDKALRRR